MDVEAAENDPDALDTDDDEDMKALGIDVEESESESLVTGVKSSF